MKLIALFLVLQNHLSMVETQTGANAKALREKLFVTDKYDKKVRSANDQTDATGKYETSITFKSVALFKH